MDLLFHRYASPFSLFDELILSGDFSDFINVFMEGRDTEMQWEYYLAKVFDKSFNEFKEELKGNREMTETDLETTIQDSMSLTMNFIPDTEGVK